MNNLVFTCIILVFQIILLEAKHCPMSSSLSRLICTTKKLRKETKFSHYTNWWSQKMHREIFFLNFNFSFCELTCLISLNKFSVKSRKINKNMISLSMYNLVSIFRNVHLFASHVYYIHLR